MTGWTRMSQLVSARKRRTLLDGDGSDAFEAAGSADESWLAVGSGRDQCFMAEVDVQDHLWS
jgi:hypothetical protein